VITRRMKQRESLDLRDVIFVGCGLAMIWGVHFLSIPWAWICGGAFGMYLTYASTPVEEEVPEIPNPVQVQKRPA
jgi:hypothetical protein